METLLVRMHVELDQNIGFWKWMPDASDPIVFRQNVIELKMWFKPEGKTFDASNVSESKIYVDCTVTNLSPKLAEFIQSTPTLEVMSRAENKLLADAYEKLGQEIYVATIGRINRIISYARSIKRQAWLQEISLNVGNVASFFVGAHAIGQIHKKKFRFMPTYVYHMTGYLLDEELYLHEDDWPSIKAFVVSKERPPLVGTFLANAEQLLGHDHGRAALAEAVSALEVALSGFAKKAPEIILDKIPSARGELPKLHKLIFEKYGVRGAFAFLLPIILSETEMPTDVLKMCLKAIDLRNNVMHTGQRKVEDGQLRKMLSSINKCCRRFEELAKREK